MPTLTANPCLFYFIHLDSQGFPIPGTMFSKKTNKLDPGYKCFEARLTSTQSIVPAGQTQCFGPNGLRYYYRVNSRTGQIIPNSFFSQRGKPKSMCSGTNTILEYIPNSSNVRDPE